MHAARTRGVAAALVAVALLVLIATVGVMKAPSTPGSSTPARVVVEGALNPSANPSPCSGNQLVCAVYSFGYYANYGYCILFCHPGASQVNPGPVTNATAAEIGNEWNLTANNVGNSMQLLNTSVFAWDRQGDSAATLQLSKTSFDPTQDLVQSGLAFELASIYSGTLYETDQAADQILTYECAYGNGTEIYASNGLSASLIPPSASGIAASQMCPEAGPGNATSYHLSFPFIDGISFSNSQSTGRYFLQTNSLFAYTATGGASCTANALELKLYPAGPFYWLNATKGCQDYGFNGPTGAYSVVSTTLAANTAIRVSNAINLDYTYALAHSAYNSTVTACGSPFQFTWTYPAGGTSYHSPGLCEFPGAWQSFPHSLAVLMRTVETDAQTYWSYLKLLGCQGTAQDPPACGQLPIPSSGLSTAQALAGLNSSELASLWYAYLTGLSQFYNSSDYRSHSVPPGAGSFTWTNLAVTAYGNVYIANRTLYPNENYGKPSTWAYTNQQLVLMPSLANLRLKVGATIAIPSNDPTDVFLPNSTTLLHLRGNGTPVQLNGNVCGVGSGGSGGCNNYSGAGLARSIHGPIPLSFTGCGGVNQPPCGNGTGGYGSDCTDYPTDPGCPGTTANSDPTGGGDAVYVSVCVVNGAAQAVCQLNVTTINWTLQNLTCATGGGLNGTCKPVFGGSGGFTVPAFPNLFGWLCGFVSFLCSTNWGSILSSVVLVVVVAVVAYVAYAALSGRRRDGTLRIQGP